MSVCCAPRNSGPARGVQLAAANVIVIALGIGVATSGAHTSVMQVAMFVVLFAIGPAAICGAVLGWLAEMLRARPRWLRMVVIAVPAQLLLVGLADMFHMMDFAPVAAIPTAIATLVLEHLTRAASTPAVPVARVH